MVLRRFTCIALGLLVLMSMPLSAATANEPAAPPAPHLVVALGDSITSAWGSGLDASGVPIPDDNQAASWATGTDRAVDSHVSRLAALFGSAPAGVDLARAGRKVTDDDGIGYQATIAPDGTDYVLIEAGSSDLCAESVTSVDDMTSRDDFATAVQQTLQTLVTRFPAVHILVASIPNWYGLWQSTSTIARPDSTCPLLFSSDPAVANPGTRIALQQRTIAYNKALDDACSAVPACRYDGGAVYAIAQQPDDLSAYDHFHPSVAGQAKIAAATWPESWWGGDVAPAGQTPPAIDGVAAVGSTLTGTPGTWAGSPAPTLALQWQRCTSAGCAPIAGATDTTYVPVAADVGATLQLHVTATNTAGSAAADSAPTAPVVAKATAPPVALTLPTVTGVTQVNQTLSATNGTWSNSPTGFIGQWLRCVGASSCTEIAGATSGVYTLTQQDVGAAIRFRLTAINGAGSTVATSAGTAVVTVAQRPLSIQVVFENPTVYTIAVDRNGVSYGTSSSAGDPQNRLYRSFDEGRTWAPLYDFPDGSAVAGVMSVLSSNTLLVSVEVGDDMHLFRSADGGTTWTDVFQFLQGYQTLTAHSIADDGRYVYLGSYNALDPSDHPNWVWRSADDGQTWSVIRTTTTHRHVHMVAVDPSTGALYVAYGDSPTQAAIERSTDQGLTWQTVCTGAECVTVDMAFDPSGFAIFGTDHPTSPSFVNRLDLATGAVTPIAGLPGASYSAFNLGGGVWLVGVTHEPTSVYPPGDNTVHLFGSSDGGRTFTDVLQRVFNDPTTDTVLSVQFAFPGGDFPVTVSQAGAGTLVARVSSTRPIDTAGPAVSGTASTGDSLTASPGTWSGAGTPTLAYQWQRCPVGGVCADIGGATASTYAPGAADVGNLLRVRVTATNGGGSTLAFSPPTGPVVDAGITVTSSIVDGQKLSGRVAWTAQVSSPGRRVVRVVFAVDGRTLSTDTSAPYAFPGGLDTTSLGDGSHVFSVTAVATDGTSATVSATGQVSNLAPPRNTWPPRVLGLTWVGGYLGVLPGTWQNSPTSLAVQWQRCDSRGQSCTSIAGATGFLYHVAAADERKRLRAVVTARNAAGATSATSAPTDAIARRR